MAVGSRPIAVNVNTGALTYSEDVGMVSPADVGLIAWSFDPAAASQTGAMSVQGRVEVARIYNVPPGVVTNLHLMVTAGGSTLTANQCLAGLYSTDGTLLGTTVDQAAAWQSTGWKTMALASPVTLSSTQDVIMAWFYNGTTGPTLARGSANSGVGNHGLTGSASRFGTADTGRTTSLPATLGAITAGTVSFPVAIS